MLQPTLSPEKQTAGRLIGRLAGRTAPHARYAHGTAERRAIRIASPPAGPNDLPQLTPAARGLMAEKALPDLSPLIRAIPRHCTNRDGQCTSFDLRPLLDSALMMSTQFRDRILAMTGSKITLVDHPQLRVRLIHWPAGTSSSIHGHAFGGGVFKVLHGELLEHRYRPDDRQQWMSSHIYRVGQMARIDDAEAYHAVSNPTGSPAISLHIYSPGRLGDDLRVNLSATRP